MVSACRTISAFIVTFDENKAPLFAQPIPDRFLSGWGWPKKGDCIHKTSEGWDVISGGFDSEFATKNAHEHLLYWEG